MGTIQALRGTRDILPDEVVYWQYVEAVARDIFNKAAYREMRTPIFEQTELFERGIGEATDVVGKEMYTFQDRGDRSITLRPELTAGLVRSLIEHKLYAISPVQRMWSIGPVFRYERPQAGRQRQFHQIDVEIMGSADPRADAEVIVLATDLLNALGLKTLKLDINSVGTSDDRQRYRQALIDYLTPYKAELDADSQDRLTRNPLRILDSKDERTKAIVQDAPNLLDYLSPESQQRFERVQQCLTDVGIAYNINAQLVRGLDYYTHTAFEIQSDDLGAQATVCGGGRYDGLVAQLGGPDTPAIGWGLGMERLILLLQQLQTPTQANLDFYVVSKGDRAEAQALQLSQTLRHLGFSVELDLSGSAFGKQFKRADRSGAIACLILGDAEAENGMAQLKWMQSGEQGAIAQADLPTLADDLRHKIADIRANQKG
ncbi:histidine--tRNA ligase [Oscillatoria sp. FACHB-1407]|uniref:histidine--tRNA ligase n=1 Tax=Oscillatoria sp. FACHB-1407 TaxID=2692847 RepID=UPI0016833029|nr:histidine--tRNA ligase [Oscillatoria sp. FACHB-1407]MBD2461635.1 histidine--tRNA ligase [Oscillatoria sp. FACHB-1407]